MQPPPAPSVRRAAAERARAALRTVALTGVASLGALATGWLTPAPAGAQTVASERVVAVVGSEPILLSELEEQTVIAASQAGIDEGDVAALDRLRRQVLDQMVADLIVVAAASEDDSVQVSESQVSEALEAELDEIRARFPTAAEFERELARSEWRTLDNYRKNLRRIKRRELLAQAFLARNASGIRTRPVTDEEVRAAYEADTSRFGTKPVTVTLRQLNLIVQPTAPARAAAKALADSLAAEVRQGGDFSALARAFSDDEGTKERGGDLGYFKRGAMVPAFEDAAFGIDSIGNVAGPVETEFGFHIVRLDDRQGPEIKARHLLITPQLSDADRAAARALGEALVDSLGAGADFDSLAVRHSAGGPGAQEPIEGPLTQLPPDWQQALRDLPVGGTSGLLTTPSGFAILRLVTRGGGEPYTFEDLAPRIRAQLEQARGQEEFIESLRKDVHVEVRLAGLGPAGEALGAGADAVPAPRLDAAVAPASPAEAPPDTLPQVDQPSAVGTPREAYTPPPDEDPPAPLLPLENPAPIADTPPSETPPSPAAGIEAPAPDRVEPSGAVDSTDVLAPGAPQQPGVDEEDGGS